MSLLPRRGSGRHGQAGGIAVHPGWTLSPTSVTDAAREPSAAAPAVPTDLAPTSRWTSSPASPDEPAQPVPVQAVPVPAAPVRSEPAPIVEAVADSVDPGSRWATEWEAVAAAPRPGTPAHDLHSAAALALDRVFGSAPAPVAWPAAPQERTPPAGPAPLAAPPQAWSGTALDLPLEARATETPTPLEYETASALRAPEAAAHAPTAPAAAAGSGWTRPAAPSRPPTIPPPAAVQAAAPVSALPPWPPAPPTTPPPARTVSVPQPAQDLVDLAMRTAPSAPVQRRSTVRLGFTDASVVDLRADDPIAQALHTVAEALMGREST